MPAVTVVAWKNKEAATGNHRNTTTLLRKKCRGARVRCHEIAIVAALRSAAGAGPSSTMATISPIRTPEIRTLLAPVAIWVKPLRIVSTPRTSSGHGCQWSRPLVSQRTAPTAARASAWKMTTPRPGCRVRLLPAVAVSRSIAPYSSVRARKSSIPKSVQTFLDTAKASIGAGR